MLDFDPEGEGYDYESADKYSIVPDKAGHYQSRVPETGLLLKGRKHKTWQKTVEGETEAGFLIIMKDGRYYSIPSALPIEELKRLNDQFLIKEFKQSGRKK